MFEFDLEYYHNIYNTVNKYINDERKIELLISKIGINNLSKILSEQASGVLIGFSVWYTVGKERETGVWNLTKEDLFPLLANLFIKDDLVSLEIRHETFNFYNGLNDVKIIFEKDIVLS